MLRAALLCLLLAACGPIAKPDVDGTLHCPGVTIEVRREHHPRRYIDRGGREVMPSASCSFVAEAPQR